ncbi:MAG: carboxypeptidase-like regulatory domain-containing protein [Nitrospirota bacterium]
MKKKAIIIIFSAVLFLIILVSNIWGTGWIFYTDGPYRGKVTDADTGQPIEGAVVVGMWRLEAYGGPAAPSEPYCDAQETVTGKNGEFEVPRASCFHWWPFTKMGVGRFTVFKPGYLSYPPTGATFEERKAKMPGFTGQEFRDKKKYNAIKLGKHKTFAERRSTLASVDIFYIEKVPLLQKLVDKESKALGFDR